MSEGTRVTAGDVRAWLEGVDDDEEVGVEVLFPQLGHSPGDVMEARMGLMEPGHCPGVLLLVGLPGRPGPGDQPSPAYERALAELSEATRETRGIPF